MSLYCPQCSRSYDGETQCPRCAVQLGPEQYRDDPDDPLPPHWSRNPWGRTILGVLLAQGLFFIINEVLLASRLAAGDEPNGTWTNLSGLLTAQALQFAALLCGSMLAGAGQRNSGLFGAFVGVWNGILSLLVRSLQGEPITAVDFYSQPMLHTTFGAIGGLIGSWIWKPPSAYLGLGLKPALTKPSSEFLAGVNAAQVSWIRVLAGIIAASGGVVFAESILAFVVENSEGRMSVRNSLQQEMMTLEIIGLALFFGGAISGASTWTGSVQGLWVGLISAALLVGIQAGYRNTWELNANILLAGSVVILCTLGGTFGGKLLPPVQHYNRKKFRAAPV